jgi:16S rRNA (guanine(966)-N(2))-methyltransferase RsmD
LFDVLCAGNPDALAGSVWLDLYAGTGAVGIEAFSRGAARVEFVEKSRKAAELIRENLRSLGIESGFVIHQSGAPAAIKSMSGLQADFVFLDPPYQMEEEYEKTLELLSDAAVVQAHTRVIAEHLKKFDPGERFGRLMRTRVLTQGDASLSFYRVAD